MKTQENQNGTKTLYVDMKKYNSSFSKYLSEISFEEPKVEGTTTVYNTDYNIILVKPDEKPSTLKIILDKNHPALGKLEKMSEGGKL